ncbi:hypothetical protein TERTU_2745 [Teredinibacter turnerae T7901]|uniref:Uncharacterized protein n=1 Tax=Teredinibacter turnerae (strain ATCC 39867 / T7901) TaxID=377629 RepID=C5BMJ4_TERTT|nr:hypothetical protein TERTU_2745 [Teredinibacter turnerae T7901]
MANTRVRVAGAVAGSMRKAAYMTLQKQICGLVGECLWNRYTDCGMLFPSKTDLLNDFLTTWHCRAGLAQ